MVGLRVKIAEHSEFYGQSYEEGTIIKIDSLDWYVVNFDDRYTNSYRDIDLIVVGKKPKQKQLTW